MSKIFKIRQSVVMGYRVFSSRIVRIFRSRIYRIYRSRIVRIFRSRIYKIYRSRIYKIFKMRKSASNNFRLQFLPIHVIISHNITTFGRKTNA